MVFRCYARGTQIRTPGGDAPIETFRVGKRVLTSSGNCARSSGSAIATSTAGSKPILQRSIR